MWSAVVMRPQLTHRQPQSDALPSKSQASTRVFGSILALLWLVNIRIKIIKLVLVRMRFIIMISLLLNSLANFAKLIDFHHKTVCNININVSKKLHIKYSVSSLIAPLLPHNRPSNVLDTTSEEVPFATLHRKLRVWGNSDNIVPPNR